MNPIKTQRLLLRPFRQDDAEAMYCNWTSDERVARYCRWYPHENVGVTKQYLNMCIDSEYCWAITLKENDEPIGCIDVVGKNERGVYEIGYVLSHAHWGKSIMTEAAKAVIEELFRCGFERIGACHDVDNPASGRVMEKCGMVYQGSRMTQKKFGSDEQCKVKYYEISRA